MALFGQAASSMFGGGGGARGSAMTQPWMQPKPTGIKMQQPGGIGPSSQIGTAMSTNPTSQQEGMQPQQNKLNRTQWRDAWMGAGKMNPQQADEWLKSHGATQMEGGGKAGRWTTPHGESLDLQIGRGAAMAGKRGGMITPGWTRMGGGGNKQGPMGPSGGMMGGGVTGYGGGIGPTNEQGLPPGTYGGGNPYYQMMGGMQNQPPSMTQQLQGNQPQAQQMPQRNTPWGQMNRMQPQRMMSGY